MSRLPLALAAVVALVLARTLPAEGLGLALRLGAATLVLLIPGALVGRAVGRSGAAGALVWGLTALAGALALTFAFHGTLRIAELALVAVALVALPFALRREPTLHPRGWSVVAAAGAFFGVALWRLSEPPAGDALFHLARVRKLLALDDLSLARVGEFADGGLHPGYAFPLWHALVALVARSADVDPALVVEHWPSVLAPLAFLVAFEAGTALFRSAWLGSGVVTAQLALTGLSPDAGGAFRSLALPATARGRLLLVPAVLALVFRHLADPTAGALASVAAGGLVLALVHPTYAVFVGIMLAGLVVARVVLARRDAIRSALAVAAFGATSGAVAVWLLPLARQTASHDPTRAELVGGRHGFERYPGQIDVFSDDRYRLAPEVLGRSGAVAVAALAVLPLALFAARRRWAAFTLGASLALLALLLTPVLFPAFSDTVSLSQARRAAGFLPFAFVLAGAAAVLARLAHIALLPMALVAGYLVQREFPGDFGYVLREGGPPLVAWIAVFGGAAALVLGAVAGPWLLVERRGALAGLAVLLFVAPIALDARDRWRLPERDPAGRLTPGLEESLVRRTEPGDVVFSDPETSYRVAAVVPVYVAVSEPTHVADTPKNRPYVRERAAQRFFRTGRLAIPRAYHADWVILDRRRYKRRFTLPYVYRYERYTLYRLRARKQSR